MKDKNSPSPLLSAMENASKLIRSNHTKPKIIKVAIIALVALLFLIIVFSGSEHKKEIQQHNVAERHLEKASLALQQSLKKLKAMSQQSEKITGSSGDHPSKVSSVISESLLDRMKAPTTMGGQSMSKSEALNSMFAKATNTLSTPKKPTQPSVGHLDNATMSATKIKNPDYVVASGELIHGVLTVASNSDLPGMVSAIVSQPVYSFTGGVELVPAGSRLIGQYSSAVSQGQSRLFIIWNRLLLPNGVSVQIDSPSTDAIGQSGAGADYVNRHFWERFGQATLLSILGASTATAGVDSDDQYNSASEYRSAIAESLQASANDSLQDSVGIKPTLKAYQGKKVNVFIAHDLDFYSVRSEL